MNKSFNKLLKKMTLMSLTTITLKRIYLGLLIVQNNSLFGTYIQLPHKFLAPYEQVLKQASEKYDIFDEIDNYYIEEYLRRVADGASEKPDLDVNTAPTADAEITL